MFNAASYFDGLKWAEILSRLDLCYQHMHFKYFTKIRNLAIDTLNSPEFLKRLLMTETMNRAKHIENQCYHFGCLCIEMLNKQTENLLGQHFGCFKFLY